MKQHTLKFLLSIIILLTLCTFAQSQTQKRRVVVSLRSGDPVVGNLIKSDDSTVEIEDADGQRHSIPLDDVSMIMFVAQAQPATTENQTPAPASSTTETENSNTSSSTNESHNDSTGAPKTVHVRGYYRRDGTYVQPHTRSAPHRRP